MPRLKNFKQGKTYKKRMAGKSHKVLKKWYGMKAFDDKGFIHRKYLNKGIKRAKRNYKSHPSEKNLTIQKRLIEAKNFGGKRR